MAPISRTAFLSLLFVLTASSPALALPADVVAAAGPSVVEYPDLLKRVAFPQQGIAAPAATVLPGPPGLPNPNIPAANGTSTGGSSGGGHGGPGGPPGGFNPFGYTPSFSTAVAASFLLSVAFIVHAKLFVQHKTWFAFFLPLNVLVHAVGCVARVIAIVNPPTQHHMTTYIVQKMTTEIVPALLAVLTIMIFTRVIWWVTPNEHRNKKTIGLPIHHISLIWGLGIAGPDIVKAVAGGLGKPKGQPDPKSMWNRIQQICLVIQFFVLASWTTWCVIFMRKANRWIIPVGVERAGYRMIGWATVAVGALLSWRILYLTLEFDAMYNPKAFLSEHEWPFYLAAQLPVLAVYIIFAIFHPGKFFPREYTHVKLDTKKIDKEKFAVWLPTISRPMPSESSVSEPGDGKGGFEVTMSESVAGHPGKKI